MHSPKMPLSERIPALLLLFLGQGLNSLFARMDDMTLESFDGLEMIPREILQQGTKKIATSIRGLLIAQKLKENKETTSFR